MIEVKGIDHVAICVPEGHLDEQSRALLTLFGLRAGARERVAGQKTDVAFLHAGECPTAIEMIAPAGNEGLEKFLERRGQGLHHLCFEVADLAASLRTLKAAGVALIDETPRPGARGHLVGFLHPKATGGVLIELCQHQKGQA